MNILRVLAIVGMCALAVGGARAGQYYVAPDGSDEDPGTAEKPFATIQKGADVMVAGDTCIIRGGTYRQTVVLKGKSGAEGRPISFIAAAGERVILDGTEPITAEWSLHEGKIYKTKFSGKPFEQLFVDGKMQIEARWPDMRFDQRWDRGRWADSEKGSRKDLMVCKGLARTEIDWTGAVATLNVAHQFKTWTRTVLKHGKGADRFTYELAERLSAGADQGPMWADDKFFLSGKLEALDAPTEWFYDQAAGTIYLHTDTGESPAGRDVRYKKRTYAFDVADSRYVQIKGLEFFAATFQFANCDNCVIEDCRVRFPTYSRRLTEMDPRPQRKPSPSTGVSGSDNVIRRVGLVYSNTHGLVVRGTGNLVENCVVRDVNWVGAIAYAGIAAHAPRDATEPNRVSRCTVATVGNIGIQHRGPNTIIEYNHVHHTGLACKDIAAVHTGSPLCRGSVVRYNWVHHSTGLGIRGDDQTRGLTVHHNVVWNCAAYGIIVKGDDNLVYNNTLLGPGQSGVLLIPTRPEPKKWWTRHPTLELQNRNSYFCNNLLTSVAYRLKPLPDGRKISHNRWAAARQIARLLVDIPNEDFRPRKTSRLIDAGRRVPNAPDEFKGDAPDIGAYEYGEDWRPGADWSYEQ
ncbi:MAG: right-handed parallel beta-helix repeat-containing protein [Planctomycetota bacterium]|jgi:hypothetical protein